MSSDYEQKKNPIALFGKKFDQNELDPEEKQLNHDMFG